MKTFTPLRYPGGKTKFYPHIRALIYENDLQGGIYIEPFAGGAGLALSLLMNEDVDQIVLNDLDPAIYAFWKSVVGKADDFCELLERTPVTTTEWENQRAIYRAKDISNFLTLGFSAFYLNRTNVSGVLTGGMIGGKMQSGTYKLDSRFSKKNLIEKIQRIARYKNRIQLKNQDAAFFLSELRMQRLSDVFLNIDPPYVEKGARLYKNSFEIADHSGLREIIAQLNYPWVVTYDLCPLVENLYKDYRRETLDVSYSVRTARNAKEYIFFSHDLKIPVQLPTENQSIYQR